MSSKKLRVKQLFLVSFAVLGLLFANANLAAAEASEADLTEQAESLEAQQEQHLATQDDLRDLHSSKDALNETVMGFAALLFILFLAAIIGVVRKLKEKKNQT